MATVRLENLGKTYPGGIRAVDRLDLIVAEGEFLVLVGPSGCGKTTTLRMIAGLEQVTDGTIHIDGRVVNQASPRDRDIAMVFQNSPMYPNRTVRGNMAFGLRRRGVAKPEIQQHIAWAAELLGIEELLDRKPHALSGGQRQRAALARALVRRPKVFLFDEPLSNLDAKLRADMRAELKRLHRRLNVTTVYVTHDQEEAMTLGDRIAVLREGRLQQCGTPLDVYHAPNNRFVAGFIGTPAMNFIEGRLRESDGRLWFESPCFRAPINNAAGNQQPGADSQVALGIRPENLQLRPSNGQCSISGTVEVVEPLGSTMDLCVRLSDGQRLVSRVAAEPIQCDIQTTLYVDPTKTHLFPSHESP